MTIFDHFPKTPIDIVAPDGTLRCSTTGIISTNEIQVPDASIDVETGDEVRRLLPNGKEEVFIIRDAVYSDGLGPIPPHYNLKVFRKGSFARHTGGHYINVSGHNARVNLNSTDNSTNVVNTTSIFAQVASAIEQGVDDAAERETLLEALKAIETSDSSEGKGQAYQRLIANAANHMTILAPFLGPLTQALSQ